MPRTKTSLFSSVLILSFLSLGRDLPAEERPNILIILADDLGFSDLGCYGAEIKTPNLDALAFNGLRFTQFYNTARCWPTRAALLTGFYAQQIRRDKVPGIRSGGGGKRPSWAPLISTVFKSQGYRTYHCGKWHIDGMPLKSGFDRSYYLRDQGRFFSPKVHYEDDKKLPEVPRGTGFYGTTAIADYAIKFLEEHHKKFSKQPFFHYLAFTAPHFPLHALQEDIDEYRDIYKKGWDLIRKERQAKQKKLGLSLGELSKVEKDVGPPYHFPKALEQLGSGEVNRPLPWDSLTEEQKEFQAIKMAIHAAMIHRMDIDIGRILKVLKKNGQFENTIIVFLSDNGASAEIMVRTDGHDPKAKPGSAASYLCLGPGWSTVSNTPFRRHKTWVHEGGISTPLIFHWPKGELKKGELRNTPGHVIDFWPTFTELAGVKKIPEGFIKVTRPGNSLVSVIRNDSLAQPTLLWWLHEGNRAIRKGDWKAVEAKADGRWELFNLKLDRSETSDLSKTHVDKLNSLKSEWEKYWQQIQKQARQ